MSCRLKTPHYIRHPRQSLSLLIPLMYAGKSKGWESLKSASEKIRRGEKPREDFNLWTTRIDSYGQTWTVIVRNSSDDKRPTLELYRQGKKGETSEKRIKIRFGGEELKM